MMLGRTMVAERVYDVDRGIDYLATRRDMDLSRLGVMGNSGGGSISTYAAALLPRLRAAMPSSAFCAYAGSIMSIYHCGDNYVPGIFLWAEMGDVLGLFAPRPVVVVAGRHDSIFPIEHVRKAFSQLKTIYRAAGAPGSCQLVVGDGGHRFYADDAWPVMQALLRKAETPKSPQRTGGSKALAR
jgi:pimeloyl-ACP methyl ester carboxylesterase